MAWFWFIVAVFFAWQWRKAKRPDLKRIEAMKHDADFLVGLAEAMGNHWDNVRRPLVITEAMWQRLLDIRDRALEHDAEEYPLLANAARRFEQALLIAMQPGDFGRPTKAFPAQLNSPAELGFGIAVYLVNEFNHLATCMIAHQFPYGQGKREWRVSAVHLIESWDERQDKRNKDQDG